MTVNINKESNKKDGLEFIRERDRKNRFLLLFLPWLSSVVASMSSTALGNILFLKTINVEAAFISSFLDPLNNSIAYIGIVAFINFFVDVTLLSMYLLLKDKINIDVKITVFYLLIGHMLCAILYLFSFGNEDIAPIVDSMVRVAIVGVFYFLFFRFLPKKYLETLVPYSEKNLSYEVSRLLYKPAVPQNINASKKRLSLYFYTFLMTLKKKHKESDLVEIVQDWRNIEWGNSKKVRLGIEKFCDNMNVLFLINLRKPNLSYKKESYIPQKHTLFLDSVFYYTIYSSAIFSNALDLIEKSQASTSKKNYVSIDFASNDFKKIIKYHLDRAADADVISARQKIFALVFIAFIYLATPTLLYIVNFSGGSNSFLDYKTIFLVAQYLSVFVLLKLSVNAVQNKFRSAGVDVFFSNKYFGYFINSAVFLILFVPFILNEEVLYQYIGSIVINNFSGLLTGIFVFQLFLSLLFVKPPSKLMKTEIASSLLVRELLMLRAQMLGWKSIKNRRVLSRHVYFIKKYFSYIAKDLISYRFDSFEQKTRMHKYFEDINEYVDELVSSVRLGAFENKENALKNIDAMIYLVAIEEFGEIPKAIPAIGVYLDSKSLKVKSSSSLGRYFQVFDTSWSARTLLVIVIIIIINLINPSLWVHIQNLSAILDIIK